MAEPGMPPDRIDRWLSRLQPALIVALLACALSLWQWWQTHAELTELRHAAAQKLAETNAMALQARVLSQQSDDNTRALGRRLADLEARMAESQSQQQALQALYHNLAESRDDWTLADIEQVILSANQQLQINNNVKAAIIALQDALARLRQLNRPQFAALQAAIDHDVQRLQTVPQIDVMALTARLDQLIASVDALPLVGEHEIPIAALAHPAAPRPGGMAQRFMLELWQQIKGLVQVRRLDTPDTALLLPEQSYFLRQNLKLRLLAARIALFAHDETSYQTDLHAAQTWLRRYFDTRDDRTQQALSQLERLMRTPINPPMPSLQASLDAMHDIRTDRER